MKTPKEYKKNLDNKIITEEMLENALYSVNKRAKNWRDNKRKYKRCYQYKEEAEAHEKEMYSYKEKLLSILKPKCIHKEFGGYKRIRVCDNENEYQKLLDKHKDEIVWTNGYFDENGDYVEFFDYEDKDIEVNRYYLYYEVGSHSFHTPIEKEDINKYELPIIEIDTLETEGFAHQDLLSVQFVRDLIAVIEDGGFSIEAMDLSIS